NGERGPRGAGVDGTDRRPHERAPRRLRPGGDPLPPADARRGANAGDRGPDRGRAGDRRLGSAWRRQDRAARARVAGGRVRPDMTPPEVTVEIGDRGEGVAAPLDEATTRITELETRGSPPRSLSVPPAAYERIARVHARALDRGVPLIVLGLP